MITPTTIECPRCKVTAGQPCVGDVGGVPGMPYVATLDYHHAERVDKAMATISDRLDAVKELSLELSGNVDRLEHR